MITCDFCNTEIKPDLTQSLHSLMIFDKLGCAECHKIVDNIEDKYLEKRDKEIEKVRIETRESFKREVLEILKNKSKEVK